MKAAWFGDFKNKVSRLLNADRSKEKKQESDNMNKEQCVCMWVMYVKTTFIWLRPVSQPFQL